ncbi:hypothetical protein HBH64_042540 [Parastagonospora nodorum]|nr:hypothetical protein HBH64_042540 [Parastagonospora nodorum]
MCLVNPVNNDVSGFADILTISFCTLVVSVFGYKIVHAYEFWSWIPTTIVFSTLDVLVKRAVLERWDVCNGMCYCLLGSVLFLDLVRVG